MNNHVRIARILTRLLDTHFGIGKFRFGLEPLLGLIPGVGDFIGLFFSFYIVWIATRLGLPEKEISRMIRHIVIDFIIGIIPFIGDIGDFAYKANSKNMAIIDRYVQADVIDGRVVSG